jgi:hypothetical protein
MYTKVVFYYLHLGVYDTHSLWATWLRGVVYQSKNKPQVLFWEILIYTVHKKLMLIIIIIIIIVIIIVVVVM